MLLRNRVYVSRAVLEMVEREVKDMIANNLFETLFRFAAYCRCELATLSEDDKIALKRHRLMSHDNFGSIPGDIAACVIASVKRLPDGTYEVVPAKFTA